MVGGICFQFDASYHAVMALLVLEATPFLPIATGASFKVVVVPGFKNCSSTLFWSFGRFEPRSLRLKVVLSKEFAERENESVKL